MKKILILVALLLMPSFVSASTIERNVKIQFESESNTIETKIKFRIKDENDYINDTIYETNTKGIFNGKISLDEKTYYVEIVDIPSNIVSYTTSFEVTSNDIVHNVDFDEQQGLISIRRQGIFFLNDTKTYISDIKDAKYQIYAKEKINSYTGKKFAKDELVGTVTTSHGFASMELPFGKYYFKEESIDDYFKDPETYNVTIDLEHIYNDIYISTLHNPLEIESNIDYDLCLDEDITVDDKVVATKGTCYGQKDKYYVPYGRYILKIGSQEQVINFDKSNHSFEFQEDCPEDLIDEDSSDRDDEEDDGTDEDYDYDEDEDDDNVSIKAEYNGTGLGSIEDDINVEDEDQENTNHLPKIQEISNNVEKSSPNVTEISNNKMPVTSSRTNHYSLALSGLMFIILSILKKQ